MSNFFKHIMNHKRFFLYTLIATCVYFSGAFLMIEYNNEVRDETIRLETSIGLTHYRSEFNKIYNDISVIETYIYSTGIDNLNEESFDSFIDQDSIEYHGFVGFSIAPDGIRDYYHTDVDFNVPLGIDLLASAGANVSNSYTYATDNMTTVISPASMSPSGIYGVAFRTAYYEDNDFSGIINYYVSYQFLMSALEDSNLNHVSIAVVNYNGDVVIGTSPDRRKDFTEEAINSSWTDATITVQKSEETETVHFMASIYIGIGFITLYIVTVTLWCYFYFRNSRLHDKQDHLINYDNLTGLPNRRFFEQEVRDLIGNKVPFVLGFGDLDNFKNINDVLGHTIGDQYLTYVSSKMQMLISDKLKIYRWGGDEFMFLFLKSDRNTIFDRIDDVFDIFVKPFDINGSKHQISISIGLVEFPIHGTTLDDLVKRADIVMYDVKAKRRNTYSFFQQEHLSKIIEEVEFQRKIDQIDLQKAKLFFQPIVSVSENKVVGFEALSRIYDNDGVQLNTQRVIKTLEKDGTITQLDRQVFRTICKTMGDFESTIKMDFFISFNVSPMSLNEDFIDFLERTLHTNKLDAGKFIIEIIETLGFKDLDISIELLARIKDLGFKIAMDDFGMGYSSLSYISKLPLNLIKVDQSFIQTYTTNSFNKTILNTVQDISASLKLDTLIEGIETFEQLEYVKELGAQYYQGFIHSRPEPAVDVIYKVLNKIY